MLQVLRITGDSMSPEYKDGDFVVILTAPFFRRARPGEVVVFSIQEYGTLIKRVERLTGDGELIVSGTQVKSLDSRRLGPISPARVRGKVIWHIH